MILGELLAPEFSVRIISREPSRLTQEIRDQVELVCGSIDDAKTLRSALDGVESMFWCVPRPSSAEADLRGHYARFSLAACQALRAAGTQRVVAISCVGQAPGLNAGPTSVQHVTEDILNKSGAAIRHLRCGAEQTISVPGVRNGKTRFPTVRDIADVALRWLVRRDWQGIATVPIGETDNLGYEVQTVSFTASAA